MAGEPTGLGTFVELFRITPAESINEQCRAAWNPTEAMVQRIDDSVKKVNLAYAVQVTQELRFRKKYFSDAVISFSGAWFIGYVFARAVYGTVLTSTHYSTTQAEIESNGQCLIDAEEAADESLVYTRLPEAIDHFRDGLFDGGEYQVLLRKLGHRLAEGALVSSRVSGLLIAIAESPPW